MARQTMSADNANRYNALCRIHSRIMDKFLIEGNNIFATAAK